MNIWRTPSAQICRRTQLGRNMPGQERSIKLGISLTVEVFGVRWEDGTQQVGQCHLVLNSENREPHQVDWNPAFWH